MATIAVGQITSPKSTMKLTKSISNLIKSNHEESISETSVSKWGESSTSRVSSFLPVTKARFVSAEALARQSSEHEPSANEFFPTKSLNLWNT